MLKRRRCNRRCWYAKQKNCGCVCGGKNHGQGMVGEEMVRIEQKYPILLPVRFFTHTEEILRQATSYGITTFYQGRIFLKVSLPDDWAWIPLGDLENYDDEEIPF